MKSRLFLALCFAFLSIFPENSFADGFSLPGGPGNSAPTEPVKSLVLGDWYGADSHLDDIRIELIGADSRFDQANSASLNLTHGLPSMAYLQQFDSVLVFTDSISVELLDLSDLLGNYVDAGGRVVLSTFWGQQAGSIGGKINSAGYNPLLNPRHDAYRAATLGAYNSLDPLMQGVTTLEGTMYLGDYSTGLDTGATLAASWDDGSPLAAYNYRGNVIAITLNPNVAHLGHASGDYPQLFANGLAFHPRQVPEAGSLQLLATGLATLIIGLRKRAMK